MRGGEVFGGGGGGVCGGVEIFFHRDYKPCIRMGQGVLRVVSTTLLPRAIYFCQSWHAVLQ